MLTFSLNHSNVRPSKGKSQIYISSLPKYSASRASSQLEGSNNKKKSVSIVSLSPSDSLNYGKDVLLYNPYGKGASKQKIQMVFKSFMKCTPIFFPNIYSCNKELYSMRNLS